MKKYQRTVNVLDGVDTGATATAVALEGIGAGLRAILVAAPAIPTSLGIFAACSLLSAETKIANRRLRLKARKHDQIRILAESKLNSIAKLVIESLEDETFSHP